MTSLSNSTFNIQVYLDENDSTEGTTITIELDDIEIPSLLEFGTMLFDVNNIGNENFDLTNINLGNLFTISESGDSISFDLDAIEETFDFELEDFDNIELPAIDDFEGSIAFFDEDSNPIETIDLTDLDIDIDDLLTISESGDSISFNLDAIEEATDFELENFDNIELPAIDDLGGSIAFFDADSNLVETIDLTDLDIDRLLEIDFDNVASLELNFESDRADSYSNIYVFGDSLVDTGNLFNATTFASESSESLGLDIAIPVVPPSPPYFEGRLSNGQIWVDNLADEFDVDLTPATELSVASPGSDIPSPVTLIDGNPVVSPFFDGNTVDRSVNFGYAGATTGESGTGVVGDLIPGMEQQVEFFVTDHLQANQAADGDALYVLWGGSNDYFDGAIDPELVVDNIESEIELLYDAGARDFLVVNLPDLGAIPEANNPDLPASPEELSQLSDTHNSLLEESVNELEDSLTGANITVLDIDTLFDDIQTNPEEFGLTNVTEPFLDPLTFTPTAGANPDDYLFYDTLHPTEAGHAIISDYALETLAVEADI